MKKSRGKGAGRPRKQENSWLPPLVEYRPRVGYVYRNKATREYRNIAPPDAPRSTVWSAYEALSRPRSMTLARVVNQYLASPQYKSLKPATQGDYAQYSNRVVEVFGEMAPDDITSPVVQLFMDARGAKHPTAANHEKSFLSLVMNWGKARGYVTIANPCDAVRACKTAPGGRYVGIDDYAGFYNYLLDRGHVMHAVAMEIAYLCGARQQDVLRLLRMAPARPKPADCFVCGDGLHIVQGKTGKAQLKLWTPRLLAAVRLAESQGRKVETLYLLRNTAGQPFTRGGFNATWQRRQREALEKGIIGERFRFHDLKITALSDYQGDDLAHFSGHKTKGMAERYNRTPDRVKALIGRRKDD